MRSLRKPITLGVCCVAASALTACSRSPDNAPPDVAPLRIVVSIPPLAGLVRDLAPEGASVTTVVPPGASEHGYEPPPSAIAAIGRADLVVLVGMGLEPRIERALRDHPRPDRAELRFADAVGVGSNHDHAHNGHDHAHHHHDHAHNDHNHDHAHHDHDHGPDCDHASGNDNSGGDPHLWLDPVLVAEFVPALRAAVADALERRSLLTDAEGARLDEAAANLTTRVNEIDRMYSMALAPYAGAAIVTHHDAFGRLAARYGLEIAAVIRLGEGSEPTPGAVASVARLVRERNVGAIFIEPQLSTGVAQRIADAAGVRTITLDPLGRGDWGAMMRANLAALFEGLALPDLTDSSTPRTIPPHTTPAEAPAP